MEMSHMCAECPTEQAVMLILSVSEQVSFLKNMLTTWNLIFFVSDPIEFVWSTSDFSAVSFLPLPV